MIRLIDTHCHLDAVEFDYDRQQCIAAARSVGVAETWVPAVQIANFAAVRDLCRDTAHCRAAYGIHPLYVDEHALTDLPILRQWLETEQADFIGEIGLDGFHQPPTPLQQQVFIQQLTLAVEFNLPILVHARHATELVLQTIKKYFIRPATNRNGISNRRYGIIHAFNGSLVQAQQFVDLGFKLGFGGAATFAGSKRIHRLIQQLPLSALVLETDAPDMAPAWCWQRHADSHANNASNSNDAAPANKCEQNKLAELGQAKLGELDQSDKADQSAKPINRPVELYEIAKVIADIRGISMATLAAATTANAESLLH